MSMTTDKIIEDQNLRLEHAKMRITLECMTDYIDYVLNNTDMNNEVLKDYNEGKMLIAKAVKNFLQL